MKLSPSQIIRHFSRSGAPGKFTDFYSELSTEKRSAIDEILKLHFNETAPIIVFLSHEKEWAVLFQDRIIFTTDRRVQTVHYNDIIDISIVEESIEETENTKFVSRKTASMRIGAVEKLFLTTKTKKFMVPIESGPPLFGVWKVLTMV